MRKHNDEKVLTNLKKARTHIDRIINMLEADDYCIDVIQQINAVLGYLNSARSKKLESHLESCFLEGLASDDKERRRELISEVLQVIKIAY